MRALDRNAPRLQSWSTDSAEPFCWILLAMAFIDARTLRDGERIEADICVIGSGAAGLAIAKRFFGTARKVAVLESGGEQFDEETQLGLNRSTQHSH